MPRSTLDGAPSRSIDRHRMPDVLAVGERLAALSRDGHDFAEFFRSPSGSLSLTVARWPAGSIDDQTPHTEDEVYYVLNGRAALVVEGLSTDVVPGSVAFVAAGDDHRFVDITEDLEVLVFWSPARHSNTPAAG
jgi:mannose-6-phosphate isomerase-like protein (cupin superfamily)